MRRVHSAAAALLLLVLAPLVGCTGAPPVQRAGDSVMLVAQAQPDASMDALIVGVLTRTDAGCLAVDQGEQQYVLQFPAGSELSADGESVEVPGEGTIRVGDEIHGGGGYVDIDAPEECDIGEEFAVWQSVI